MLIFLLSIIAPAFSFEFQSTEEWKTKLEKVIPLEWKISNVSEHAVPYNLSLTNGEKPGISFTFTGPTMVLGPRGINQEKESFQIWIMSVNYSGKKSEIQAQFYEATILGSNNEMCVYSKSFVSDTPT